MLRGIRDAPSPTAWRRSWKPSQKHQNSCICPAAQPRTHAATMRCDAMRCDCDTKCTNGNLFPTFHPVLQSAVIRPWEAAGWRANRRKVGGSSLAHGKWFCCLCTPSLCYCSLALEHPSVHVPIFSDKCHVIRSVVDRRRPDMLVPGARALTAQEYVTFDRRKNEQKPPVRAVG